MKLKPAMGFAVYRPDGSIQKVIVQAMKMTKDERMRVLAWARFDDNSCDVGAGIELPRDGLASERAGYVIARVQITPSASSTTKTTNKRSHAHRR